MVAPPARKRSASGGEALLVAAAAASSGSTEAASPRSSLRRRSGDSVAAVGRDDGLAAASSSFSSALPSVSRLRDYKLVPSWAQLPFLVRGYRLQYSPVEAVLSAFAVHGDTVNIWTHLLGLCYFVSVAPHVARVLAGNGAPARDYLYFALYVFAAGAQMGTSAVYHLFRCVSNAYEDAFLQLDVIGITGLILASYVVSLGQGFECAPWTFVAYVGMQCVLTGGSVYLARRAAAEPAAPGWLRASHCFMVATVAWGAVPCAHILASCRWDACANVLARPLLGMFIHYGLGALFFFSRFPERVVPGVFDIVGASHQLWHVCVFLASRAWLLGMLDYNSLKALHGGHVCELL